MDYRFIEQLIERYFACETSLQEEQILKTFFTQDVEQVPGDQVPSTKVIENGALYILRDGKIYTAQGAEVR